MTINTLLRALVAELVDGEILDPLAARFTLAHVWADLARLAGEEPPAEVVALVDQPLDVVYASIEIRRGSYVAHALQLAD